MTRRTSSWFSLSMNAARMGMEAQTVIGLRLMRLAAGGPAAAAEAQLMVTEKVASTLAVQSMLITGVMTGKADGGAGSAVAHYRRKVRANRRRLTKAA